MKKIKVDAMGDQCPIPVIKTKKALGEIKDIKEARKIIANSENVTVYEPQKDENWDEIYKNVKESLLC